MSSILNDVKTLLGIQNEYNAFDNDLILHINSAFAILYQLGVGPTDSAFKINSDAETWESFSDITNVEDVKEYVTLKVKIVWDTALPNSVIEVIKGRINELEWRLRLECDKTGTPSPEPGPGPTPTTDTYSKEEIDQKDAATLSMAKAYTDVMTYSKAEVDNKDTVILNNAKAYTDEELDGYYTKTEVDNKDTATLDSAKGYTDTKISDYYTKTETYTKIETDTLLNTKQGTLTAGDNITIDANNVIKAKERSWKKVRTITIDNDNAGQTVDGVTYGSGGDTAERRIQSFSFTTDEDGNSLSDYGITSYYMQGMFKTGSAMTECCTKATDKDGNDRYLTYALGGTDITTDRKIYVSMDIAGSDVAVSPDVVANNYFINKRFFKKISNFVFQFVGSGTKKGMTDDSNFEIWMYGYWDEEPTRNLAKGTRLEVVEELPTMTNEESEIEKQAK